MSQTDLNKQITPSVIGFDKKYSPVDNQVKFKNTSEVNMEKNTPATR